MTVFRRVNLTVNEPGGELFSGDVLLRLARGFGRLLLWGCVLLLLVRGALSVFSTGTGGGVGRSVTVTVARPAHTETLPVEGK
jgi:hypothetical protein